jgi:Arc/MetJ-type ribon-helix-helix transcriptional regulator
MVKKEVKKVGKYTTVSIPIPLMQKIKGRIEGTGFTSVSDYVTYVLREVIASLEEEEKKEPFSREEEEKVKERLRALGYLD